MSPNTDPSPFTSTEEFYATYRPGYGEPAIQYLVDHFELDDSARVLDLGCGAGQIAIPLAEHVGEVVGMDPNEEMLRFARQRAEDARRESIEWIHGSDADLDDDLGTFRLTTMGRSFHWMDQERTLERLLAMTEPGGGVAILTDREWLVRGTNDWHEEVYELAAEYLDDLPERVDPDEVEYDDPWDEKIAAVGFDDVEVVTFEFERDWDADSIVGYVFSLSYCSPDTFGDDRETFEADLRGGLDERDEGPFVEDVVVEVIAGEI